MTNWEFMKAAEEKLTETWNRLNEMHGTDHPRPELTFDLSNRHFAGMAHYDGRGNRRVQLNMAFVQKNAIEMINQTTPHEAIHCFLNAMEHPSMKREYNFYSGKMTRRSPHGPAFMNLMRRLGCEERKSHNFQLSDAALVKVEATTFAYKCNCPGRIFRLSVRKHNGILRGRGRYCRICGATLTRA